MKNKYGKWRLATFLFVVIGIPVIAYLYHGSNNSRRESLTDSDQVIVFESRTEQETTGFVVPAEDIVSTLVKELPDVEDDLKYCVDTHKGGASNYKSFLVAYRIHEHDGKSLYFVRPALEPYCSPLYGAHSFQFWFLHSYTVDNVAKYHVVLDYGADSAIVLDAIHNNQNDIMSEYCVAAGCDVVFFQFNGKKYVKAKQYFEESDTPNQ